MNEFVNYDFMFTSIILCVTAWDLLWKGIALWHAASEKRKFWFILILITNSVGLIPVIFYYKFRNSSANDKKRIIKLILFGLISLTLTIALMQTVVNTMYAKSLVDDTPKQTKTMKPYQDDNVKVDIPLINSTIANPLTVTGEARGTWFFEANFTIYLYDSNNNRLGVGIAQAKSEWMTEDFVPFSAEIDFEKPTTNEGYLILEKANPSGLSEKLETVKFPIKFN